MLPVIPPIEASPLPSSIANFGTLDGGAVLPGFSLSIREWFARAGERTA
jgi:hypothetical protein